jgi:Bacterial type II and III secretion system protein
MQRPDWKIVLKLAVALSFVVGVAARSEPQSRRQVKVLVESQQSGTQNQESLQGSGSVIIRKGNVSPSGRVTGGDRQTTVQRSTGIFTLVQDGGESILSVATQVPYSQTAYYYNYALGTGYIQRQIVFTNVGTSLRVNAGVLPDNQIRVRLTPRISYFSAERSGAIDFTEAATELIVPSGQPVSLGGSTTNIHEITRQSLGYRNRASSGETNLVLTATVQ